MGKKGHTKQVFHRQPPESLPGFLCLLYLHLEYVLTLLIVT
jgi:hypothetical protein